MITIISIATGLIILLHYIIISIKNFKIKSLNEEIFDLKAKMQILESENFRLKYNNFQKLKHNNHTELY